MEIRNIITFLRVAELLSFTKAAEELGYSQSAITVQIKQLEDELEVPLFERIGRQVALTEAGKGFIDHANEIYKAVENAKTFHINTISPKGNLRIGTIESIATTILPDILIALHRAMPRIHTVVKIASTEELFTMLNHNDVDLLLFVDQKIYSENYITAMELEEEVLLVAGKKYALEEKDTYTAREISKEQFIFTESGISYNREFENFFASKNCYLEPFLEIGNTDIIIELLKDGCGISLLPKYTIKSQLKKGSLRALNIEEMDLRIKMQLLYNRNKWITPQMEQFISLTKEMIEGDYL